MKTSIISFLILLFRIEGLEAKLRGPNAVGVVRDAADDAAVGIERRGRRLMGLCEGDCDGDDDCAGDLVCFERDRGDELPAGCNFGNDQQSSQIDYCVEPGTNDQQDPWPTSPQEPYTPAPAPVEPIVPQPTTGSFRLKLYWEQGYMWQDEDFERRWCIMRDFDGYPGKGKCWYGTETRPCNLDHVYMAKCQENDARELWEFQYVDEDQVLIKAAGTSKCLQRDEAYILLTTCDEYNEDQHFFAIRGGFEEYRFEISQKTAFRYCLNQAHHPKPGEVVAMYPCSLVRSDEHMTSYWEKDP